jgi:hypothetical protein
VRLFFGIQRYLIAPEKALKLLLNNALLLKNRRNICKVFCIFSHFLANILPSAGLMNTSLTSLSIFSYSKRVCYAVCVSHFSYGLFQGRLFRILSQTTENNRFIGLFIGMLNLPIQQLFLLRVCLWYYRKFRFCG